MAQKINEGRRTAHIEGDFVVFLIGARFNSKLHLARSLKDLGGRRRGMQAMLDHLVAHPEKGLLGYEMGLKTIVQYWRSFEQLEAFAKDADDPHLEVWRDFWRRVGKSGRTGIWHETFLVRAGEYETIYGNMPDYGLGKAERGGHGRGGPFGPRPPARRRHDLTAPAPRTCCLVGLGDRLDPAATAPSTGDGRRRVTTVAGTERTGPRPSRIPPLSTPHRRSPP